MHVRAQVGVGVDMCVKVCICGFAYIHIPKHMCMHVYKNM